MKHLHFPYLVTGCKRLPPLPMPLPPGGAGAWCVVRDAGPGSGAGSPGPMPPVSLGKVTETHSDSASLPVSDGE